VAPTELRPQGAERGFALLLVFLLAAAVALMLYIQIPRVAFESERDKEQTLLDRGEGYKRGIQMFYVANKRYPTSLDELEKLGDKRFLRRRYKDPITGKDEWRLIHTNGAFLTDSIVQKPPGGKDDPNKPQQAGNLPNGSQLGGTQLAGTQAPGAQPDGTQGPVEVNAAVLRRPSDRPLTSSTNFAQPPTNFGQPPQPPGLFDPNNPNPADPNANPAGNPNFQQGFPGQLPGQPGEAQAGVNPQSFPPITTAQYQPVPVSQFPPITLQPGATQPFGVNPNQPFNPQIPGQQVQGQPSPAQQFPGQQFSGQQFPGQQPLPGQQSAPTPAGVQYRIDPNGQFVPINPAQGQGIPGQPQVPGQFFPQPGQAGQLPGQNPSQFTPSPFPGVQGGGAFPAPPISNQGFPGQGLPGQGSPGQPQGNFGAPGAPNAALGIINQLLTTPRQPPAGIGGGLNNQGPVAGGIAGVASTATGASIKRYKDRGKYNEWEFTFELQGAGGVPGQQPGQQLGQQPGQAPGAPGQTPQQQNPTSPFGSPFSPFGTAPGAPPAPPRP